MLSDRNFELETQTLTQKWQFFHTLIVHLFIASMPLEVQLSMCSAYGDKKAAALWVVVKAELRTGLMDWTMD